MEHPIVQKAIDKLTEAYKPIVERRCPECGEPNDHLYPDPTEGGRCRDCCSMCSKTEA